MKKKTVLIGLTMMIAASVGCSKKSEDKNETKAEKTTTVEQKTTADTGKNDPQTKNGIFANMPEMNQDTARVNISGNVAYFQFVTSGDNGREDTVICYSMTDKKLLGSKMVIVERGDVYPVNGGDYYLLDYEKVELTLYGTDCTEKKKTKISGIEGIGYASCNDTGSRWIFLDINDGNMKLYNAENNQMKTLDLRQAQFYCIGYLNNLFYLSETNGRIYSVDENANVKTVYESGEAEFIVNGRIVGLYGKYLTAFSIDKSSQVMMKAILDNETVTAHSVDTILSVVSDDNETSLHFYDLGKLTSSTVKVNGTIEDTALTSDGKALVMYKTEDCKYSYQVVDPATGVKGTLTEEKYNADNLYE